MNREQLFSAIKKKKSFLCIGLDSDITKIPRHLLKYKDPLLEFNRLIIEATNDLCVAYKPNIAFYEALGSSGWNTLEKTFEFIPKDIFTIADAKRGDIGNTSSLYAKAFFERLNFDAITVAPYMGEDSVRPFLQFEDKWVILLVLTSNPGSVNFQTLNCSDNEKLYQKVLKTSLTWANSDNMMYVVGATKASELEVIRRMVPDHFLLIPGVGAQGGNLQDVCQYGLNKQCGLLVNASRNIIYASDGKDFDEQARREAAKLQQEMELILTKAGLF